jgi:NAD(P)H dehydrogenase (quinone)
MKISIILANPNDKSFCHAIAKTCCAVISRGHIANFHDLYKEHFPALLPLKELGRTSKLPAIIQKHCDEIKNADGIIIIHPNWWGQPPAILKGWVDRIIRPGIAYEFKEKDNGEGVPHGLLKAGFALVFNTSNPPQKGNDQCSKTRWRPSGKTAFSICAG